MNRESLCVAKFLERSPPLLSGPHELRVGGPNRSNDGGGELLGRRPTSCPRPEDHALIGTETRRRSLAHNRPFFDYHTAMRLKNFGFQLASDPQENAWNRLFAKSGIRIIICAIVFFHCGRRLARGHHGWPKLADGAE